MGLVEIPKHERLKHLRDRNARGELDMLDLDYEDDWEQHDVITVLVDEVKRAQHAEAHANWKLRQLQAAQMEPKDALESFLDASTTVIAAQGV